MGKALPLAILITVAMLLVCHGVSAQGHRFDTWGSSVVANNGRESLLMRRFTTHCEPTRARLNVFLRGLGEKWRAQVFVGPTPKERWCVAYLGLFAPQGGGQ